jgi:hypothetical protein
MVLMPTSVFSLGSYQFNIKIFKAILEEPSHNQISEVNKTKIKSAFTF